MKKTFSTTLAALILLAPHKALALTCTKWGVLACLEGTHKVKGQDEQFKVTEIKGYIVSLLEFNIGYIMLIAITLIVFSGIQYMTSIGAPGEQTKARERILGIFWGIIFYLAIRYIAIILADGIFK